MLFNSFAFFIFLPLVFFLYWFLCHRNLRWQNALLLAASYFFYGWWSWTFLGLLVLSTLLDFLYGFGVASSSRRRAKLFLWLSIINNLGILAVFKYYNFFAEQFQALLAQLGWQINPLLLQVALPVGISFYTFHGMSYVFDIYRGTQKPVREFLDYAVFVSFFPLLVAGPIERAHHLLPQVQQRRTFNAVQAIAGCRLILWGLFKKVVIADSLATTADLVFEHYTDMSGYALFMGAIAFSFQIYGDFSGYSDIALGTARLFGIELLSNFRFPYFSRNLAEFWRRWHISLSSWFRDYLYIPLGGSKSGTAAAVRNTFIIFVVSGFWHGASWNFLAWGALHACGFLPLLLVQKNRLFTGAVVASDRRFPTLTEVLQMLATFSFVTLAWIFFRTSQGLSGAMDYIRIMFSDLIAHPGQLLQMPPYLNVLGYILILLAADWWLRRNERDLRTISNPVLRWVTYVVMVLVILYHFKPGGQSFIYFQF